MSINRLILAVIATLAFTGVAFGEDPVDYRLPPGVYPTSQMIELRLDPAADDYSGNTTIKLTIEERTDRIGIYLLGLDMTRISLSGNGAERALDATADDWDIQWLAGGQPLEAGDYDLNIEFEGPYSTDSLGMHRVSFEDNDYVFTQFESVYARRAFPVFDEPSFKIPFQLTINAPAGLTVIFNTPVAASTVGDDWQRVEFMQTKPLPSYLIAYAVGPLDRAEIEGMSIPGFIYTPKSRAVELAFVLRETPKIVSALEAYVGPEVFRESIQAYLKKYAWSNATETDLWNVLGATSGLNVATIASALFEPTWLMMPTNLPIAKRLPCCQTALC